MAQGCVGRTLNLDALHHDKVLEYLLLALFAAHLDGGKHDNSGDAGI